MEISLSPELAGRVLLGVFRLDGVEVKAGRRGAERGSRRPVCAEMRSRYGAGSAEVPGPRTRGLYKALGIDPTKTRPSNEALLRRALKGESLYRINTLVDALNLSSLRYQVSFRALRLRPDRAAGPPAEGRARENPTRGFARGA